MTKILLHTNTPTSPTGYGVAALHVIDQFIAAGHEVAVSATYGHRNSISTWTSPAGNKVRIYPEGWFTNSPDVIAAHAMHWFEGDPQGGIIIPLLDVWSLAANRELSQFRVAAWAPVDHFPLPVQVVDFFLQTEAIPIAMSRFGEAMFRAAGLEPLYVPLTVDTSVYKPTEYAMLDDGQAVSAEDVFDIPPGAFVFLSVAMNKSDEDRKGFNEIMRAFASVVADRPDAFLYCHTDPTGAAGGLDLHSLAAHAGVPLDRIGFADPYAYRLGLDPGLMALLYSRADVLLAPSHGEGFGIPIIEAQACGTPVITSDFSACPELVGAGWLVDGQLLWDNRQKASYVTPYVVSVIEKMREAYASIQSGDDYEALAVAKAAEYEVATVFEEHWVPALAELDPTPPAREPDDPMEHVDILVPVMRESNRQRFYDSLATTEEFDATGMRSVVGQVLTGDPDLSFAQNVNKLFAESTADWVLVTGDDVEFLPGWFDAARSVSTECDVIGVNDSEPGRVRNPDVAAGRHADHFFIRRSYVLTEGACLDGPGVCMPEAYGHFYVDREVIGLAKARGAFKFAKDCRIVHHHPGYDGDEEARWADPLYAKAQALKDEDERTFLQRAPLIAGHRR